MGSRNSTNLGCESAKKCQIKIWALILLSLQWCSAVSGRCCHPDWWCGLRVLPTRTPRAPSIGGSTVSFYPISTDRWRKRDCGSAPTLTRFNEAHKRFVFWQSKVVVWQVWYDHTRKFLKSWKSWDGTSRQEITSRPQKSLRYDVNMT